MNLQELSAAINTLGAFCGPRGKNFLAHVEVPAEVQAAFAQLQTVTAPTPAPLTRPTPQNKFCPK